MKKWYNVMAVDLLGEAPAAEDNTVPHHTTGMNLFRMNMTSVAIMPPKS